MFTASLVSAALLALSALSASNAAVVPRQQVPPGWKTGYLESYEVYHTRYLALGCQFQHGKPFFDLCCHPLLATESLSSRDPSCTPPGGQAPAQSAPDAQTQDQSNPPSQGQAPSQGDNAQSQPNQDQSSTPSQGQAQGAPDAQTQASQAQPVANVDVSQPSGQSNSASSSSSNSDLVTGGFGTYFYQNGVAGACGTVHSDSDLIVAMDVAQYGFTGVQSSLCGKQVQIFNDANGKSVVATVADACPTCLNNNSIDLSVGTFQQLADLSEGMIHISWKLLN